MLNAGFKDLAGKFWVYNRELVEDKSVSLYIMTTKDLATVECGVIDEPVLRLYDFNDTRAESALSTIGIISFLLYPMGVTLWVENQGQQHERQTIPDPDARGAGESWRKRHDGN